MRTHIKDQDAYLKTLTGFIGAAVSEIERDEVSVSANIQDLKLLRAHWEQVLGTLPTGAKATLSDAHVDTLGGVMIESADGRIRVDNTFEGRLSRLRARLQQVILERLVPGGLETGSIFGG
jgi:V/A-type H+-transporting ATPase subunit E